MSIRITRTGEVFVTKPTRVGIQRAEQFLEQKKEWIIDRIAYVQTLPQPAPKITRREYVILKKKALQIVEDRIKHFTTIYNFSYKTISIKNQKTRWGSCSSKKNLNFNCKIALLEPELVDYIVVHELCHLQEMNHGKRFWDLVAQAIPNYKQHHIALHQQGLVLS